jgi:hypothetical protein
MKRILLCAAMAGGAVCITLAAVWYVLLGDHPGLPHQCRASSHLYEHYRSVVVPQYERAYADALECLRAVYGHIILDIEAGTLGDREALIDLLKRGIRRADSVSHMLAADGLVVLRTSVPVHVIGLPLQALRKSIAEANAMEYFGSWRTESARDSRPGLIVNRLMMGTASMSCVGAPVQLRIIGLDGFPPEDKALAMRIDGVFRAPGVLAQHVAFVECSTLHELLSPDRDTHACSFIRISLGKGPHSDSEIRDTFTKASGILRDFEQRTGVRLDAKVARCEEKYAGRLRPWRLQLDMARALLDGSP